MEAPEFVPISPKLTYYGFPGALPRCGGTLRDLRTLDRAQLRPLLRRRIVGGYQRGGVHHALDQMWARVHELEHELASFREQSELLERSVHEVATELASYRARED